MSDELGMERGSPEWHAAFNVARHAGEEVLARLGKHPTEITGRDCDEIQRLDVVCTCGSGGHPRFCLRHPWAYRLHVLDMNYDSARERESELELELASTRAALARAEGARDHYRKMWSEGCDHSGEISQQLLDTARWGKTHADALEICGGLCARAQSERDAALAKLAEAEGRAYVLKAIADQDLDERLTAESALSAALARVAAVEGEAEARLVALEIFAREMRIAHPNIGNSNCRICIALRRLATDLAMVADAYPPAEPAKEDEHG